MSIENNQNGVNKLEPCYSHIAFTLRVISKPISIN